jgi:hypothetical protein
MDEGGEEREEQKGENVFECIEKHAHIACDRTSTRV